MLTRRKSKQTDPLEARLAAEAERLREEADSLPPGVARDHGCSMVRNPCVVTRAWPWADAAAERPTSAMVAAAARMKVLVMRLSRVLLLEGRSGEVDERWRTRPKRSDQGGEVEGGSLPKRLRDRLRLRMPGKARGAPWGRSPGGDRQHAASGAAVSRPMVGP